VTRAARLERAGASAARWWSLVLLAACLDSGCSLTSRQVVVVAAPAGEIKFFNGGRVETYFEFDLSTLPEWRDHHADIVRVSDITIMGDFLNVTGSGAAPGIPIDVTVRVIPIPLPSLDLGSTCWGPLHLEDYATHRVAWAEGERWVQDGERVLLGEITGDGKFTLFPASSSTVLFGSTQVENIRLGLVLELR